MVHEDGGEEEGKERMKSAAEARSLRNGKVGPGIDYAFLTTPPQATQFHTTIPHPLAYARHGSETTEC